MPRRLQQGRQQRSGQRLRRRDRPADDQVDGPRRRLLLRGHDDTQAAARYGATAGGGEVPLHRQVGGWKAMWEGEGGGWGGGHDYTQAAARYGATAGGRKVPLRRQVGGWEGRCAGGGARWVGT